MEEEEIEEQNLKKETKSLSIKAGSGFGFMSGFGIRYITPYALAIGASNTIIGLLSSMPTLLGTLSQLKSSKLIEKVSRKKIVIFSSAIQALMWLPLMFVGVLYFFFGLGSFISSILLLIFYIRLFWLALFVLLLGIPG